MALQTLPSVDAALAWFGERGVRALTTDSRRVQRGDAFIAWPGYATKKYRAWFVGLAPISHPRIIVAVMVDEPNNGKHFGGDVAAPVFSEVVQQTLRTLGVAPDLEVKTQIITKDIPAEEESF